MRQQPGRFFQRAINTTQVTPTEGVTDKAATYPIVFDELLAAVWHRTDQYANNHIEADHGRLKARLRPMRGLNQDGSATVIIKDTRSCRTSGEALRAGVEAPIGVRVAVAFGELAAAI